jgi:hypothetical protein
MEGIMLKRFFIAGVISLVALTVTLAPARESNRGKQRDNERFLVETHSQIDLDRPLGERSLKATSQADTFFLGSWTFDTGSYCDAQGWTSADLTEALPCFWHIDDFSDLGGGSFGLLVPLEGSQSLWCGARPNASDPYLCNYATLPGYGNGWEQGWCFRCFEVPDTEEVIIEYLTTWDTEPGYDYVYLEYATKDSCDSLHSIENIHPSDWIMITSYDDVGVRQFRSDTIPSGHEGYIKFRFLFRSDGAWSDQWGLWDTDGAVIIDSLTVKSAHAIYDYEDFEDESFGDIATADGDWECCVLSGYGDFAGLYPGSMLLQEDPCIRNTSCLWAFINGSTETYDCGGHPEQIAVPKGNWHGQYIFNSIFSPPLPLAGTTGSSFVLEFDVYRDLPLNNLMFYTWDVRSLIAGCPEGWRDRGSGVYYGGNKDWIRPRQSFGDLVVQGASHIQIALGVGDYCPFWCIVYGTGACHSHSPLFDNVEVYRVATTGPQWSVRDIDLFNDTFPENGTSDGTGRIDMALDRLPSSNPGILPGDSAKVLCSDPEAGIGTPDPHTGFGPTVYFYLYRDPETKPIATTKVEEDAFRWPLVDSVNCDGHVWYQFRMDTCFTEPGGPRTGPVPDAFCIDINDHYFENGDTLWFFFGAHNSVNEWTYWSQGSGTVVNINEACEAPMEMQILPGEGWLNGGDILYVDNFSGRGGQPYFDSAFELMGIDDEVDRFDKRGPSSLVGNALGYHATVAQLHALYRKIIWNSGDLSVGTVGDGTSEKADDYAILFAFLDLHPNVNGAGIYFSGDDLAQELNGMTSASSQSFKNVYMPHTLITGDHSTIHRLSPYGIGERSGTGIPPSVGVFDHGPPEGGDTIVVYGGCPSLNDFDVIAPVGTATLEMCYDPANEDDDSNPAVVAFDTLNSLGNRVATVLSGFSFHYIRDDRPAGVPDRADHMYDILLYLANITDPTVVKPTPRYSNSLAQNYPNPFNPSTTIKYSVKERTHVMLRIYNVTGQLVRTLVNEEQIPRGEGYTIVWNGRSNSGNPVSSGVYFYKIVTKNFTETKKMVLLK